MPIKIPNNLPAKEILRQENIFCIPEERALGQDIRPLKILLVNLMPTKIVTETQFARLLGNTPLQVELEFLQMTTHESKNVDREHLISFYKTFEKIKEKRFDGMIITGAPVEQMPFEKVDYWEELCEIMEWSKTHAHSTIYICWGAQAGLYYHFGIRKHDLEDKLFGVFEHEVEYKNSILFRGFDDIFMVPHSRHTTIKREDIEKNCSLKILASSKEAGVYIVATKNGKQIFVTGHAEYDRDTLKKEYFRDKNQGLKIELPKNYFKDNDETKEPVMSWKASANLLFSNWLNYFVYQTTPYEISKIK